MTTTTEFTEADLPELPEPYDVGVRYSYPSWSNKQVVAYALAAVAASRKKLMQQEPVAYLRSDELRKLESALIHAKKHKADAKKYGHDVAVYAAPMPQANESEAVTAPISEDEARSAYWGSYPDGDSHACDVWLTAFRWSRLKLATPVAARAVLAGEPGAQEKGHDE